MKTTLQGGGADHVGAVRRGMMSCGLVLQKESFLY